MSVRCILFAACIVLLCWFAPAAHGQLVQQGPRLAPTGVVTDINGGASIGYAVALSGDGNTAVIGGPSDHNTNQGAAWIFTRVNRAWGQQAKLISPEPTQGFGASVGVSADGNTAIVGCSGGSGAWIFTRANGAWMLQQKLAPNSNRGQPGLSVAISADGNTAIVGDPVDTGALGAAFVFTRQAGVWTQQQKIVASGVTGTTANLGASVALSADAATALIGAPGDNFQGGSSVGAAFVFTRSGAAWTQTAKLAGTTTGLFRQGSAVALSGDARTALVAGPYGPGGVWVFTRSDSGAWTQQAGPLAGPNATKFSADGTSVSLNFDGNIAIIGGPGDNHALLFARANGSWTQLQELTAPDLSSDLSQFGYGAAISPDTTTVIVGAPHDDSAVKSAGGAWVFYAPPVSVAPTAGTPQEATVGSRFAVPPQVAVKNALSYPAPSTTVTFAAPAAGPSGTFQGFSNTATTVTNAAGIAAAPAFTANTSPGGPYTVTAAVDGIAAPAQFLLTNIPAMVNITLQTSPPDLLVSFDNGKFAPAPLTQAMVPHSTHTIATQSSQSGPGGVQYSFIDWSDGLPVSHTISAPITDTTYTARFSGQQPPAIAAGGIFNAATNAASGGVAQGSLIAIYGSGLGPALPVPPSTLPLSPALGGTSVTIMPANGAPVQCYPTYVSATQINAIVPSATPLGAATITATYNNLSGQPAPIHIVSSGFGIFTSNYGSGPAAAIDLSTPNPLVSQNNAVHPGDYVAIFGTGLGPVNTPDDRGSGIAISPPGIVVQVVVAGQTITPTYAGRSPQYPAEDQINFQLPDSTDIPEGCSIPITVVVNGMTSNTATLPITRTGSACPTP